MSLVELSMSWLNWVPFIVIGLVIWWTLDNVWKYIKLRRAVR